MRAGRIFLVIILLSIAGAGAFFAWAWRPEIAAADPPAKSSFDPAAIKHGAELVALGNCGTCHTRADGKPLAGGRALVTPFGTIYATNITPDPETGIGRWSQEAFDRSMREGVDRRGYHLYPAFPYDHFTRLTDDDLKAIYAYLMTREPVEALMPANELPFPVNIRAAVAAWKLLFLRTGVYARNGSHDDEWNTGAYLAEGIAHCGACHTPRNVLAGEKRDSAFAGGSSEGWHAPALNAQSPAPVPWSKDSVFAYLRRGFEPMHGTATGPMRPVIENLADVPDDDLHAIARYIASLAPPNPEHQRRAEALLSRLSTGPKETTGGGSGAAPSSGACSGCATTSTASNPTDRR